MRKNGLCSAALMLAVLLTLLGGCGGGHNNGPSMSPPPTLKYDTDAGNVKYTLRDNVVQLPNDGSVEIKNVTETGLTLGRGAPSVKPGDVIVSTEGEGLLRKVISATPSGGDMVLTTTQGTVEDLFLHADINWTGAAQGYDLVIPEDGVEVTNGTPVTVPAGLADTSATVGFKVNVAKIDLRLTKKWNPSSSVEVKLQGSLSVGVPVEVRIREEWQQLKELSFMMGVEGTADLKAKLTGRASATAFDRSIPLAYLVGTPIVIGPIVFVPVTTVRLRHNMTVELEASLEAGLKLTPRVMAGARWSKETGWRAAFDPSSLSAAGGWLTPYWNLKGKAKLRDRLAVPEFEGSLRLYGVAGLYGSLAVGSEDSVEATYALLGTDSGTLKVSVDSFLFAEAQPGAHVSILGWRLADWKMPVKWQQRYHLPGFPKEYTVNLGPEDPGPVDDDDYILGGGIAPDPDNPGDILITLNAIVNRTDGTPIRGLGKSNFQVFEDGRWREIKSVQEVGGTSSATDICFCLDISGSMGQERAGIVDSIERFVSALGSLDVRLAGVTFRYNEGSPEDTLDFVDARTALGSFRQFFSGVSVWGAGGVDTADENGAMAVAYAWNHFSWRASAQKVFVLVTDEYCQPGFSGHDLSTVAALVRGKAVVHAIRDAEDTGYGGFDASELAAATGGVSYDLPDSGYIDLSALPLSGVLRSGYLARYTTTPTNTLHRVHLLCYMGGRAVADQTFSGTW